MHYNKCIMRTIILTLLLLCLSAFAGAETLKKATITTPKEGRHYHVLAEPGRTKAPTGKIEVVEFFWYGCPHCYRLESYMESWDRTKPSYITFRRVPVPYDGLWNLHARTYYTAEKLNVIAKTHRPFFDAIHKERKTLTSQNAIARFFAGYGVDPARFNDTFGSFSVEARMRLASKEADFYKISSVPTVIINGKYHTGADIAGSEANLIEVIRYLTKLEHEKGPASSG